MEATAATVEAEVEVKADIEAAVVGIGEIGAEEREDTADVAEADGEIVVVVTLNHSGLPILRFSAAVLVCSDSDHTVPDLRLNAEDQLMRRIYWCHTEIVDGWRFV